MKKEQRMRYITEAQKAFKADGQMLGFEAWRHAEVRYAIGREKRFREFDQLDLTKCLIHFRALQQGQRLSIDDIRVRAMARQHEGRLTSLRPIWEAIQPGIRSKVLRDRFGKAFFEELAGLSDFDLNKARWTFTRLSREYPCPPTDIQAT